MDFEIGCERFRLEAGQLRRLQNHQLIMGSDVDGILRSINYLALILFHVDEYAEIFAKTCVDNIEIEGVDDCRAKLPWFPRIPMMRRVAKASLDLYWTLDLLNDAQFGLSSSREDEWDYEAFVPRPIALAMGGAMWLRHIIKSLISRWGWSEFVFMCAEDISPKELAVISVHELKAISEAIREFSLLRQAFSLVPNARERGALPLFPPHKERAPIDLFTAPIESTPMTGCEISGAQSVDMSHALANGSSQVNLRNKGSFLAIEEQFAPSVNPLDSLAPKQFDDCEQALLDEESLLAKGWLVDSRRRLNKAFGKGAEYSRFLESLARTGTLELRVIPPNSERDRPRFAIRLRNSIDHAEVAQRLANQPRRSPRS